MSKTYKVSINDGKGEEAKTVDVKQGSGANGTPTKLTGVRGYRYELQDDAKGGKLAPDQVRVKRVGKNLHVLFDGSKEADLIIEDYYAEGKEGDNGSPMLVGQAENSGMYEYVPQDPALSSTTTQLKDGAEAVAISLGGGPLPVDFVLAGLPVAAAGGLGGWLAGGAAVAAGAAAGGGGGGAAVVPSGQTGFLLHTVENDTGTSEKDSITNKPAVIYTGVAERGAAVEVTVNGVVYKTTASTVDGTYSVNLEPLKEGEYTPTIKVSNAAGSSTVNGTPFTIDLSTFEEPKPENPFDPAVEGQTGLRVVITTDENNDGILSSADLPTSTSKVSATVALTTDAAVGDILTVKVNGVPTDFTLTPEHIANGKVVLSELPRPAEGAEIKVEATIKDTAGNASPTTAQDSATAKAATLAVSIINDENNDGFINKIESEKLGRVSVKVEVPDGPLAEITVTDGTDAVKHTPTAEEFAAKSFTLKDAFTKPLEGAEITVTAKLTGSPDATDKAKLDTSAFIDPINPDPLNPVDANKSGLRVSIDTDKNNDAFLDNAELPEGVTKVTATIGLTKDAAEGDIVTVTVTATGNETRYIKLTAADITATKIVLTDLTAPAEGAEIKITAQIQDKAGNKSPSLAEDSATVSSETPGVEITDDLNNDGFINSQESQVDEKISVKVNIPRTAKAGDIVTVSDGGNSPVNHPLTADEVTARSFTLVNAFAQPAEGQKITVTATYKGNISAIDTATVDTQAPNDGKAPVVKITTDSNPDDGFVNATELSGAQVLNGVQVFSVQATFDSTKVVVGDTVVFTSGGIERKVLLDTQAKVNAGVATTTYAKPAEGETLTVSAVIQDVHLNNSASSSDSAVLDTQAPNDGKAPVVKITTDSNPDDGFVNATELSGAQVLNGVQVFSVQATFDSTKVVVGDTVVFTSGGIERKVLLDTQAKVNAGVATTTYAKPAEGETLTVSAVIQDSHLNKSASSSDSAKLDTTAPEGQTLELKHDEPNDTGVFATDNITTNKAPVLTGFAEKGATVVVKLNNVTYDPIVASSTDGSFTLDIPEANNLTAGKWKPEITVTDGAGNSSTSFGTEFTVTEQASITANQIQLPGIVRGSSVGLLEHIKVTDSDAGENQLAANSLTDQVGFFGKLTLAGSIAPYEVNYLLGQVDKPIATPDPNQSVNDLLRDHLTTFVTPSTNKVYHDLFTVISKDQSTSATLDVVINKVDVTNPEHIYHTSTVAGLKVTGSTNPFDTLVLDKQMNFDFTGEAAKTNIKNIEKIDITGVTDTDASAVNNGSANMIKLSLDSLLQANTVLETVGGVPTNVHRLKIDGDSNDLVQLTSDFGTTANHVQPSTVSGYNVYRIGTDELWVNSAISNSNVTFV